MKERKRMREKGTREIKDEGRKTNEGKKVNEKEKER